MVAAITEEGHVDIVVANAGVIDEVNWKRCLDISLVGQIHFIFSFVVNIII